MTHPGDLLSEAEHLRLQNAAEQQQGNVFMVIGHVSGVDPTTNCIKAVIPSWTNDDQTYMETGWIPIGTTKAGNEEGIQILPFGGATVTDLTGQQNNPQAQPEQVLIHVLGRSRGFYVLGVQMFNQIDVPPSGADDKVTGIQLQPGEWLYKHATGSYWYVNNQNVVALQALVNPAPVLQTDQAPDSVTPTLNLGAIVDGTNSNTNGDKPGTVTSTINFNSFATNAQNQATADINIGAAATKGQTNTSNIVIASVTEDQGQSNLSVGVTADSSQGTSLATVDIVGDTAALNINVTGNTNTINIHVSHGTVNVVADTINLGSGTVKRLLNDVSAQVYNNHTHPDPQGGTTGAPNQQIDSSHECQNVYGS